jgi:aminotransferase in exopolysaccharide biosynthesis
VLHEPQFGGNESAYLQECLDSTFVSSVGPFVDRFENDLAQYTGAKHAVATVNGTAALHVALLLAGVEPTDEVLIPTLSFVATANAVRYCGAVPHFVDSDERTLGMDPVALRSWLQETTDMRSGFTVNRLSGRRIRALVPMHTFGHPSDLDDLLATAADFNLVAVEDSAESLGSWYHGQHTGTFGLLGILSFNGNKTITTGGGGAILTDDPEIARRAKHLTTTAKVPHRWDFVHDEVGFNYRMPNLNAALGCSQLEQLPGFLASKRRLLGRYLDAFKGVPGARIFEEPQGSTSNYWLQTLLLDHADTVQRDSILKETNESGFMTRPAWTLLHRLPPYADCPRAPLPIAESLGGRIISLPSSAGLA